jgi:hypothetical protein
LHQHTAALRYVPFGSGWVQREAYTAAGSNFVPLMPINYAILESAKMTQYQKQSGKFGMFRHIGSNKPAKCDIPPQVGS